MRIVIDYGSTNRVISGDFKIYGTRKDLESISQQIKASLTDTFITGWVDVLDTTATEKPTVDWDM